MTQLSGYWTTTSASAVGHQQVSYSQALTSLATEITAACSKFEGVARNYKNSLAGSVTAANTVAIDTGGAVVDGRWYYNDAVVSVNIPSAVGGGNSRIDKIVLRCDWGNFQVTIFRIAGTDAATPSAPAITQEHGSIYDIPLYQTLVNTSGVVTITNQRVYADSASATPTASLIPIAGANGRLATGWLPEQKTIALDVVNGWLSVTQGDGKGYWTVPEALNGYLIESVNIAVKSASTATLTGRIYSLTRSVAITSTNPSIAGNNFTSYSSDGVTPGLATTYQALVSKDIWRFDVTSSDGVAKNLQFIIVINKP